MKSAEIFAKEQIEFACWVEIVTEEPICIYYFGPFVSPEEAQLFLPGYIEDLQQEECQIMKIHARYCQPEELTIAGK